MAQPNLHRAPLCIVYLLPWGLCINSIKTACGKWLVEGGRQLFLQSLPKGGHSRGRRSRPLCGPNINRFYVAMVKQMY